MFSNKNIIFHIIVKNDEGNRLRNLKKPFLNSKIPLYYYYKYICILIPLFSEF